MTRRRLAALAVLILALSATPLLDAQAAIQTLLTNGPTSRRINITFFSEGYTAAELPGFTADASAVLQQLLATPPFNHYSNFFNAHAISVASAESGADHYTPSAVLVSTHFNSTFDSYGTQRLLTIPPNDRDGNYANGQGKVDALVASLMPETDIKVMIVNDPAYGGSGGQTLLTSKHPSSPEIAAHELGHSFAGLGDEYSTPFPGYPDIEEPNTTRASTRETVKWRNWIAAGTPVPTPDVASNLTVVGLFEGAHYHATGWYRPKHECKMRTLGISFCEICAEANVLSIYRLAQPIDAAFPETNDVTIGSLQTFRITPLRPAGGIVTCQWFTNGVAVSSATNTNFTVTAASLGTGTHLLKVIVADPTPLVRTDTARLLFDTNSWTVRVTAPSAPVISIPPASQTVWEGANVSFNVSATGTAPLTYRWRFGGLEIPGATNATLHLNSVSLADSGGYDVVVSNSFGSVTSGMAVLTVEPPPVAPAITGQPAALTVFAGEDATFAVAATGTAPLSYFWRRNGAVMQTGAAPALVVRSVVAANAGEYSVIVSNAAGVAVSENAALTVLVPPPFAGVYQGLFFENGPPAVHSSGLYTATVQPTRAFRGTVQIGRGKFPVSGRFDGGGRATNTIPGPAGGLVTLALALDMRSGTSITGSIFAGGWTAPLRAHRNAFHTRDNPATALAGRYTMAISGATNGSAQPHGDGFATISVSLAGTATLSGHLADGSRIAQYARLSDDGGVPFFAATGAEVVFGWLQLRPGETNAVNGTVHWMRPPGPAPALYTNGFAIATDVVGSEYVMPADRVLNTDSAWLVFDGGPFASPRTNALSLTNPRRIIGLGPDKVTVRFNAGNGIITGAMTPEEGGRPVRFHGVLLQRHGFGTGYFPGETESGRFYFGP
jgi:hypothetical protein